MSVVSLVSVLEAKIKQAIAAGRAAEWQLAEALAEFDHEQGWLVLGYENQTDWLQQPGIGIERRTYFRYVRRWKLYGSTYTSNPAMFDDIGGSKLDIMAPLVEDQKVKLSVAVRDCRQLSASALRVKYAPRQSETMARLIQASEEVHYGQDVLSAIAEVLRDRKLTAEQARKVALQMCDAWKT